MSVKQLLARPRPYLTIEPLPPECRPCHVSRRGAAFLLWCHSTALRVEVALWTADNLTRAELNALRAAFGQPPVGMPMDEGVLDGTMETVRVPAAVWLGPDVLHRQERTA